MSEWNNNSSNYTFFKTNFSTTSNKDYAAKEDYNNDSEFGIYVKNSWFSAVSNQTLAITQYRGTVRASSGGNYLEITHADIVFNGQQSFNTTGTGWAYDYESVLLHELGHFIGFPHADGQNSVMRSSIGMGQTERQLLSYDIQKIDENYAAGTASSFAAMTGGRGLASSSAQEFEEDQPIGELSGTIELRADGECRHYVGEELVHSHSGQ